MFPPKENWSSLIPNMTNISKFIILLQKKFSSVESIYPTNITNVIVVMEIVIYK